MPRPSWRWSSTSTRSGWRRSGGAAGGPPGLLGALPPGGSRGPAARLADANGGLPFRRGRRRRIAVKVRIPKLSLVALIGASGSGKTTFARRHFLATEVITSDFCRALLADDENDQRVTDQAFELLHTIAG